MKTKAFKRMSALALSALMLAGTMTFTTNEVKAAGLGYWPEDLPIPNYWYYKNETLQPYGTCLQIGELRNWSPDNDPDARYNRGAIPLRDRWMGPNVNPLASRDAKVMPLAMSNARASEAPSQGADDEFVYAFNNFQYVDTYNFWGGSSAEGPIAIPSPEHIDSAHRNGVAATGTIFIPWGDSTYGNQFVTELVEKAEDGSYPCADKLIEIAQYYGFDGYIFNAESGTGIPGFKDFLAYMQEKAPENFRVSWYNGSGSLSEGAIKSWMQDGNKRINDEWWLDMGGAGLVDSTIDAAYATNRSKWDIHSTWENFPMQPNAKGGIYQTRLDKDGKLKISLGILAPTASLTQSSSADDFMNVQDQKLWVGPTFDPSSTYRPDREFCGFANLVTDQTPILGTDFVTHFNPGNGYKFFEDGKVVGKENGWYNRSLTEVLPTWRWIIDAEEGASKLNAKIDYEDAFFGGASMKVSGKLTAAKSNHIKLYSTKLDIKDNTKLSLTYKTPDAADVKVSVGLCFGEDYSDKNFKFYPVEITGNGKWNEATVDLGKDAGKQAIAISLKFESAKGVEDYKMNLGKLAVTTNEAKPAAPSKATIDEVIYPTDKEAELRMYWEKGENSFIDLVYRVSPEGKKEFVGATPSDALYISKFKKLPGETSAKFEIVSFSENGVKGGSTTLEVKWPGEVENGYEETPALGENLALKKPAVSGVSDDGSTDKINDGVIPNSKWCGNSTNGSIYLDLGKEYDISRWIVYHANARGAGEGVDFNTVAFEMLYAGDDNKPIVDPSKPADQQRIKSLKYTEVDRVTNNKANVTDRNLSKPIKARYIQLHVTKSDNCPWKAIRIYEFELYSEKGVIPVSAPQTPLERNVSIKNNVGAKDTIVFDNVAMQFSSGSLSGGNGVVAPETGYVHLYNSMDAEEPFASVRAEQTTTLQKQNYIGTATFKDLNLNAKGGRLWYTVQDASNGEVIESPRYSIEYAPETGDSVKDAKAELTRTTKGVNLTQAYGKLKVSNLPEGAYVKVYPTKDALAQILTSNKANEDGVVTLERVPLDLKSGKVYYEVHMSGKADSERYEIAYTTDELKGDKATIDELIKWYSTFDKKVYIPSTWGEFEKAREALNSLSANSKATEVDKARKAIKTAEEKLLKRADGQRYKEIYAEWEEKYKEKDYTQASFAKYKAELDKMKALIDKVSKEGTTERELEDCRVQVEKAIRALEPAGTSEITGVIVTPSSVKVKPGETQEFTAKVLGKGDFSQDVKWKLEGQTSDKTTIKDGLLTVGADEKLETKLTVTATSVQDETKSATATVTVSNEETPVSDNVASNAEVVAYSGDNLGSASGPDKLFDGKAESADSDKWCVNGNNQWVAFDIGKPQDVVKMVMKHAEFAGERPEGKINTSDYNFKVLNTEEITEEEFLAKTPAEQKTICEDNSYWKQVVSVTGNTKAVTEDVIALDAPARIYKLQVTKTDTTGWGACVRIYELELYASEKPPVGDVKVSIEPKELVVTSTAGQKGQFTANVTGTDNVNVNWKISGNTSDETLITNGQLFLGEDETASKMTVTATSVADPKVSATATVIVEQKVEIKATENGSIKSDDADGYVKAGTTVTLTVTPDKGYKVAENGVTVNTAEKAPVEVTKVNDTTYTFVMPEKPVNVEAKFVKIVDKSALEAKLAEAEGIKNNNYTDTSWTNLQSEIAKAKAVVAKADATQEEVDNAVKALENAIKGLKVKADKSALEAVINEAKELDLTKYTEESVAKFNKVLEKAKAVYNDNTLTTDDQAVVDEAVSKLRQAIKDLEPIAKLDKSELDKVIKEAEGLDLSKYTEESVANLNKALEEAKAIMADESLNADDQGKVDNATKALRKAIKDLEVKPGVLDKSRLENLVKEVEKIDLDKYTKESVASFNEVLKEAKAMLADQSLTAEDQAKVDEMVTKLQKAKDSLVLKDQTTDPEAKPDNKPGNKPENNKPGTSTPATGDTAPIFVTVGLLVLAFVGSVFFFWRKRRKQ